MKTLETGMLVKLIPDGDFIRIRTYDAKHGRSASFYMYKNKLEKWIGTRTYEKGNLYDIDGYSFLNISLLFPETDNVYVRISWLEMEYGDTLTGRQSVFALPAEALRIAANGETVTRLVGINTERTSHIVISGLAQKAIANLDKAHRRAMLKFLRNAFCWDKKVTIYKDFGDDFMFKEHGIAGLDGGIIPTKGKCHGRDGELHTWVNYEKHT